MISIGSYFKRITEGIKAGMAQKKHPLNDGCLIKRFLTIIPQQG